MNDSRSEGHSSSKLETNPADTLFASLRKRIVSGEWPPGTRLPPCTEIAVEAKTTYYQADLALKRLQKEGWLERRTRAGTYVRDRSQKLYSVAICFGLREKLYPQDAFNLHLENQLILELNRRHVECNVWPLLDGTSSKRSDIPAALRRSLEDGSIQAMICSSPPSSLMKWVESVCVPTVIIAAYASDKSRVHYNMRQFLQEGTGILAEKNCRHVALIHSYPSISLRTYRPVRHDALKNGFIEECKERNLRTNNASVIRLSDQDKLHEAFGFHSIRKLLSQSCPPDGVLVYDDIVGRGVSQGLLQMGKDAERLQVVLHRNIEIPYFAPTPANYVCSRGSDLAKALVDQLEAEYYERPYPVYSIPFFRMNEV